MNTCTESIAALTRLWIQIVLVLQLLLANLTESSLMITKHCLKDRHLLQLIQFLVSDIASLLRLPRVSYVHPDQSVHIVYL